MSDVAKIASGLSAPQMAVMTRPLGISTHAFYPGASHRACRALADMGLLVEGHDSIGNPVFRFTPLGLAVRAHLLENHDVG